MNDFKLLLFKHGRVLFPLTILMFSISWIPIFFEALIAKQVYAIGIMLISVGMTLYALDSVIRTIGISADRLLLLSPKTRWRLNIDNVLVLSAYLFVTHLASTPANFKTADFQYQILIADLFSYAISEFAGLGLITTIVYYLKKLQKRSLLIVFSWICYISVVAAASLAVITSFHFWNLENNWILGVTNHANARNIYATILPITVIGTEPNTQNMYLYLLANFITGLLLWGAAWKISRFPTNFIELK